MRVKELYHKQELENKDMQIKFSEQSKENVKNISTIFGILSVLIIIGLSYALVLHMNRLKKSNKMTLELKEANHNKDREMMSISLNSLNTQQFLKVLKKELEESMEKDSISVKKELKRFTQKIDYNLNHEENWENLKKHFNAIHTGFFSKLTKLHPSLSEVELKHCIFIKLHMQTKEIARVFNIDPRSVQAARYRIKKKMNLKEDVDLKAYLQNI